MPLLSCKQQAKTGPLACGGPGSAMHHSLALALHRIRDTQVSDAFATPIHFSNSPPRSRDAFCARAFAFCFAHPIEGWAERRETFGCLRDTRRARRIASKTRVNALMTQRARRLRGALRPMTRDARLSALHRGGFGLPGPRFSHRHRLRLRFGRHPGWSQRAPRTQVVVPGGRGPYLPRQRLPPAAAGRHSPLRLQDRP